MTQRFLKGIISTTLGLALMALYVPPIAADEDPTELGDVIDMVAGDIQTVAANNLTRVSITNPDIADISDAQSNKVTILAKRAGQTVLFLWDMDGKHSVRVRVAPEDLTDLKARVQKILDEANITGVTMEENLDVGKVVLSGALSKEDKDRLSDVLQPYSDNLLNLVKEEKDDELIQIDMQIVEINTSLEENLGILWGSSSSSSTTTPGSTPTSSGSAGSLALNYGENQPSSNGSIGDYFKIGKFYRTTPLEFTVNALVQEGKAKLISKPRLVVVSGKQASFLVGGEIPVLSNTISNAGGGSVTSNTSYAQYGVNLSVTPTIREGKIDILLNVDIRDIDASNSSNGNTAFITRTAQTNLYLDNKQTIALAGLIKYSASEQVQKVPFLGDIPLLGMLFRDKSTPTADANTEMVIILTPTVLTDKKYAENQVRMPTVAERNAWHDVIETKYEHEPISPWPAPKPVVADSSGTPAQAPDQILPVLTAYARMVQEKISRAIIYPSQMTGSSTTGTVKLKLHILKDGTLDSEEVMESSGNNILDQDAMQAAKTAAPFAAFSTGMDQEALVFTIPIVYNKMIAQTQAPANKVVASY